MSEEKKPKISPIYARNLIRDYLCGVYGDFRRISGDYVYGTYSPKGSKQIFPCRVDLKKKELTELSEEQFKCVVHGAITEYISNEEARQELLEEFCDVNWFYYLPTNTKTTFDYLMTDDKFRIREFSSDLKKRWDKEDNISAFAMKSDPGFTYHRLDFDLTDDPKPTPTFETLFLNFKNDVALKVFIGSLFDSKSYDQQYVWMYGQGQDGKGALVRSLSHLFGDAFGGSVGGPLQEDKYWTSRLIGKRLFVISECDDKGFPRSAIFKALTGGDHVNIEKKWGQPYSFKPDCKYIFQSNKQPSISDQHSETRRIIYVECKQSYVGPVDSTFEDMLKKEAKDFVIQCYRLYKEICPNPGMPIPQEKDTIDMLIDDFEAPVRGFIECNFEYHQNSMVSTTEFLNLHSAHGKNLSKERLEIYLQKMGAVKCKRRYGNEGSPRWVWLNLRKKYTSL